jgi:M6 family metalloprotease-like protein
MNRLRVDSIQLESPAEAELQDAAGAQAVTGPKPWVTILCRFADNSSTPQPRSWFEGLMGSTYPGMDHYWREVSYENINLAGSVVVGWYTLPQPRSFYVYDRNGNGVISDADDIDFQRLRSDCSAAADADVFFPTFSGINLMFNDTLCCSVGGSGTLTRDGQTKTYSIAYMPAFQGPNSSMGGWRDQGILAHEMGHGFGLHHSSGPYEQTYDSGWDMMSDPTGRSWRRPDCSPDPLYGCVGTGTISYHKDLLGWIPPARKFVPVLGTATTITLERLNLPSSMGYLMAQIPIGASDTQFYTVEARRFVGYDARVPGEAVVIHHVDTTRADRQAQVLDTDKNGNPNDAGAMWLPGETFVDSTNGITVSVISSTATAFQVRIQVNNLNALPALAAAVLPSSRSVQVGHAATAFAIVINAGTGTATSVGIANPGISASFTYQTTDPTTNAVTGTPNAPADIPPGKNQTYVIALTPTAPFGPTDVAFTFAGTNADPAPTLSGINTLLLSASTSPVPDIVALAATLNNDGIVNIPGATGTGVFAVATVNLGAGGSFFGGGASITASADTGGVTLPLTVSLCQTNPATGVCISAIGASVTTQINANDTPTFGVFVAGSGAVPFDPAKNRIFVRFKDAGAVTRGATSVAVRTQ